MPATSPINLARRFLETLAKPGFFSDLYGPRFLEWANMMGDKAVVLFPYAPPGMTKRCDGRGAWLDAIRIPFSGLGYFSWKALELHATDDPELIMAIGDGASRTIAGRPYENTYLFTFRIRDGQIVEYREYFNPLVLMESMG